MADRRFFTENDCSYKSSCNMHKWKSCDGGTGGDAFLYDAYGCHQDAEKEQCVWTKSEAQSVNASEILRSILGSVAEFTIESSCRCHF